MYKVNFRYSRKFQTHIGFKFNDIFAIVFILTNAMTLRTYLAFVKKMGNEKVKKTTKRAVI